MRQQRQQRNNCSLHYRKSSSKVEREACIRKPMKTARTTLESSLLTSAAASMPYIPTIITSLISMEINSPKNSKVELLTKGKAINFTRHPSSDLNSAIHLKFILHLLASSWKAACSTTKLTVLHAFINLFNHYRFNHLQWLNLEEEDQVNSSQGNHLLGLCI